MPRDFESAFSLLKDLIPFDAAQLLHLERGKRPQEVFRTGYSSNTAWALAHMFPEEYPVGFTNKASAEAPLPPPISTSTIRGEYIRGIFRDDVAAGRVALVPEAERSTMLGEPMSKKLGIQEEIREKVQGPSEKSELASDRTE